MMEISKERNISEARLRSVVSFETNLNWHRLLTNIGLNHTYDDTNVEVKEPFTGDISNEKCKRKTGVLTCKTKNTECSSFTSAEGEIHPSRS